MMKRLLMVLALLLTLSVFAAPLPSTLAAVDPFDGVNCEEAKNKESAICSSRVSVDENPISGKDGIILKATRIVSIIAGAAAVIIFIVGGMRYVTSEGDAGNVKSAKSTVMYALIGLMIIVLAQSLIEFVINKL